MEAPLHAVLHLVTSRGPGAQAPAGDRLGRQVKVDAGGPFVSAAWTLCRLPPWEGFCPTGQSPLGLINRQSGLMGRPRFTLIPFSARDVLSLTFVASLSGKSGFLKDNFHP